jgi:hypothetical protein
MCSTRKSRLPQRLGIGVTSTRMLTVKDRKSGEWRTTPVNLLNDNGHRLPRLALGVKRDKARSICRCSCWWVLRNVVSSTILPSGVHQYVNPGRDIVKPDPQFPHGTFQVVRSGAAEFGALIGEEPADLVDALVVAVAEAVEPVSDFKLQFEAVLPMR